MKSKRRSLILCHFCNKGFATERNVKTHIEKFHVVNVGYACEVCDFKSESERDLHIHEKEKHKQHDNNEEKMEIDGLFNEEQEDNERKKKETNEKTCGRRSLFALVSQVRVS